MVSQSTNLYGTSNLPQSTASSWHMFRQDTSAVIGLFILITIVGLAILSPFISTHPNIQDPNAHLIPASWHVLGTPDHLLGTDLLGRDIFSRLLNGASLTIGTATIAVIFALVMGISLGIIAASFKGFPQLIIMRVMDVIMSMPSLVLAIVVVAVLGPSLVNAGIAVTIVLIPNFVRLTRSYVIDELAKPYVLAARLDGARPHRILLNIILPNVTAPLVVQTTISLSIAIIDIAAIGFLGFGAQSPLPEWGNMLSEARTSMYIAPWAVATPGLAILITVWCINLVGDGLNSAINSKSRN